MISFEVENVKCGGCVNTIVNELSNLEGISNVSVNLETKKLSFESDESLIQTVESKLKELGYPKKENIDLLQISKIIFK